MYFAPLRVLTQLPAVVARHDHNRTVRHTLRVQRIEHDAYVVVPHVRNSKSRDPYVNSDLLKETAGAGSLCTYVVVRKAHRGVVPPPPERRDPVRDRAAAVHVELRRPGVVDVRQLRHALGAEFVLRQLDGRRRANVDYRAASAASRAVHVIKSLRHVPQPVRDQQEQRSLCKQRFT